MITPYIPWRLSFNVVRDRDGSLLTTIRIAGDIPSVLAHRVLLLIIMSTERAEQQPNQTQAALTTRNAAAARNACG